MGLLERQEELAKIEQLLSRAHGGHGGAAVVRGPAGIGKTRLLDWTCSEAVQANFALLRARCGELESDFAFGAARNLFEPALGRMEPASRGAVMAGAAEFARPALDPSVPMPAAPGLGADPAAAIIYGLYWLSVNLADEGPVLAVLDDLQWADPPSLRFVHYLARRVEDLPVLLLLAFRTGEPGTSELADAVGSSNGAEIIEPAPLSPAAVAELIADVLGTPPAPEFLDACVAASGGNPFLVSELLSTLAEDGVMPTAEFARSIPEVRPRAIVQTVLVRLARVSADARELAQAVAVLGDGATLRVAAQLAGIDERRAAQAADALAAATMLSPGLPLEFVHSLVRSAVYDSIPPAQRSLAHARAVSLLADAGAGLDAIAAHALLSEPRGAAHAVRTLRAAGAAARARGAPGTAVTYLRRALAEPPPVEDRGAVLAELGSAETLARDPAGVGHLTEALGAIADPQARAGIAIDLGRATMMAGRLDDACEIFERAITELADPGAEQSLRLEADLINAARLDIRRRAVAAERLGRIAAGLTGSGPAERLVLANAAFEMVVRGEPEERTTALALDALGDGALLADETSDAPVYYLPIWGLAVTGRLREAEAAVTAAIADARRRGAPLGFTIASCFAANVAYRMGRVADAEASARGALDVPPEQRWALGLPMGIAFLLDPLVERGDFDAAEEALREGGVGDEIPELPLLMPLLFSRGKLRLAQGKIKAGLADLLLCGERAKRWGSRNPSFLAWRAYAAPVLDGAGEHGRARELVDEDLTLSTAAGSRIAIGIATRTAGLLDRSEATLREAVATLETTEARLEHARALVDLGATLRREGQRRAAREPLAEGRELAHICGATVLERRAHDELLATGSRPRRLMRSGVDSLTPSERRVAQLAAAGQSNNEIAQALFITRKTVEKHLGNAYMKLGVGSRGELGGTLQQT